MSENNMDEVVPGLWIGDLPSALDTQTLKENNIHCILSAMRGRVTINETFIRHQIMLDDTEDADILIHFLPSIAFIEAELEKGRGVLVHCQAGVSRSATIVAAFLMYTRQLDPASALDLIREVRPNIAPNEGFLEQLEVFHQASFKISRKDKATRMYYLERTVNEIMNGDGSLPETDMFAKFPRTPSDSMPNTPGGGPRRRIRCKMCRQELAAREHMLDHGQVGPATPAISFSPVASRRPSMNVTEQRPPSRRPSGPQLGSRRSSATQPRPRLGSANDGRPRRPMLSLGSALGGRGLSDMLSMSALETEEAVEDSDEEDGEVSKTVTAESGELIPKAKVNTGGELRLGVSSPISIEGAMMLGRRLSNTMSGSFPHDVVKDTDTQEEAPQSEVTTTAVPLGRSLSSGPGPTVTHVSPPASHSAFVSPAELAAQLHNNPKLAALRSPAPMTPLQMPAKPSTPVAPPILANPKCSGYFVEPMKWMEPFLQDGALAGKIVCPNAKCNAKLGNYDWAGVCCSCREWVTPGFCIHRSKVDEFMV